MADFGNVPATTTNYVQVLQGFRDRDDSLIRMLDGTTDTNLPVGAKRWNAVTSPARFEKWDGASWSVLDTNSVEHVAITSGNPHGVTPLMIGGATQAALDVHTSRTDNPHNVTAIQLGAATDAALSSHTARTDNPHATTAAQVGALARASNLSDLTNVASAQSNLSVPSLSAFNTHTAAVNPHGLTRATIGAAASGANSDIIALNACANVGVTGVMNIGGSSYTNFYASGVNTVVLTNTFFSPSAPSNVVDLGSPGYGFNNIYMKGKIKLATGSSPWNYFTWNNYPSLNPPVATAADCAHCINKIMSILEYLGIVN